MAAQYQGTNAQRVEPCDSLDDFPTPPWAVRALCSYVIHPAGVCLEPACNRGYMAEALQEYFDCVIASDIEDYGYRGAWSVCDFLDPSYEENYVDWVVTNPPFNKAEEFIQRALIVARRGVAMLLPSRFVEGVGRYERLFSVRPPAVVAQFAERVPMFRGQLDPKGSKAIAFCWMVWNTSEVVRRLPQPTLMWIPPCRKILEKPSDYIGALNA